jgi:hypothetical protein
MIDPATALSITSLVLQVVTMGKNLLGRSQQLYASASGALVQNLEIESAAKTLKALMDSLNTKLLPSEDCLDHAENRKRTFQRSSHNRWQAKEKSAQQRPDAASKASASRNVADMELRKLKDGLNITMEKLLQNLDTLKLGARHSRWQSFRQALRTVMNESELEQLENELDRFRDGINTALLVSLRLVLTFFD